MIAEPHPVIEKYAPVSVIIPCYCCTNTIERAINSVANQTVRPHEVILIDDASGDGTLEALLLLERAYPEWVKVVSLEHNQGAASARNAGWELASEPYIAFLDSDDAWHPQKIEIQYSYMTAHPEVVLCGHNHRLLKQNDIFPDWKVEGVEARKINKWELLVSNRFVTPSVMLKRDVDQRFFEKQRYMEDHMLWMSVVCSGAVVCRLDTQLAAIYKRAYGVTGLSSQVWSMERGDLGNYRRLYREKCINGLQLGMLGLFSLFKYLRRLVIYWTYYRWLK